MLDFRKITFEDKDLLQEYYACCPYESCEYSVGIKLFWRKFYPYEIAVSSDGSLIVKYTDSVNTVFEMPVTKGGGSIDAALDEIDEYCMKNAIVPVFSDVPEDFIQTFVKRYNFTKIENYRGASDYIYRLEDLRDFKGRHYSGQRNHINKFKSLYPDHLLRQLQPDEDLSVFFARYYGEKSGDAISFNQEKEVAFEMAKNVSNFPFFRSLAIEVGGELAAFCIGEILGNRVIVHVEKALREYEGIYPYMVSEFLAGLPEGIEYVNREDDSYDKGLRTSKLQYRPCALVSKYVVLLQSELLYVEDYPEILTERLVLNEIKQEDASVYQDICLDDDRNKYWGYDYRDDLEDEYRNNLEKNDRNTAEWDSAQKLPQDYFLRVAQNDFAERICLNLAVRKDGRMIGEVVLYEADYKGCIEIGCRLLEECEGRGYGREAMLAAADWAIYKAGFRKIKAKCYKENTPSFKMLSSFMKKTGEDSTFYYFEKAF